MRRLSLLLPYSRYIALALLLLAIAAGCYLRLMPLINAMEAGIIEKYPEAKLYELDPFETYWITKYLINNGLGSWWDLTNENLVTHIFWHPWGRDFTRSELPGLAFFAATTYKILEIFNVDLMTWMCIIPVLSAALSIIGVFLLSREISNSMAAGVAAALILAFLFVDRTIAGFTVKYAFGLGLIPIFAWLHVRTWKRMSIASAIIAGILLGYSLISWAGTAVVALVAASTVLLMPLINRIDFKHILLWILELIPVVIMLAPMPTYGIRFFYGGAGIALLAPIMLLLYSIALQKVIKKTRNTHIIYLLTLIAIVGIGLMAIEFGYIRIVGKGLAALGLKEVHPLIRTVAEYQKPTSINIVWGALGIVTFIGVASAILFGLFYGLIKRKSEYLFMMILSIATLWGLVNMSYFFSLTAIVLSVPAGIALGFMFVKSLPPTIFGVPKWRAARGWFTRYVLAILLMILALLQIAHALMIDIPAYKVTYPTIAVSGLPISIPNTAWLKALEWIRENTSKEAVIVSWWDYGYWLSVIGERRTVADGSTINSSQITLLAKALMSSEEEAAKIFTENFRTPPNNTYVLTYDVFMYDITRGIIYPCPEADIGKSVAAIMKLAGIDVEGDIANGTYRYVYPAYDFVKGVYTYQPRWELAEIYNKLLYKMMINGTYTYFLNNVDPKAVMKPPRIDIYTGRFIPPEMLPEVPKVRMKIFKPVRIVAEPIQNTMYTVLVFIYKLDYNAYREAMKTS